MTKIEASQLVTMLVLHYPSVTFTRENTQAFAGAIETLDFTACQAAIVHLVRTSKWLPSVAEIIERTETERIARIASTYHKALPARAADEPKPAPAYLEVRASGTYTYKRPTLERPRPSYRHKLLTPEEAKEKLRALEAKWAAEDPQERPSEPGDGKNDG